MLPIFKKEIATFFNSLLGYLAIGLFLLLCGLLIWIFPDSNIFAGGYANLDGFFSIAPYLFIFLAPAITMRSIAAEKAESTFDLLLSRPLSIPQIVLGKYFGSCFILLLALVPTLLYSVSLYFIAYPEGNIDFGALIASYFGLLLLGCSFIAIGIFSSTITHNAIISFLAGAFLCFFFFYAFQAISLFTENGTLQETISRIGFLHHYTAISRGVLTFDDFIFFISVSTFIVSLSILVLRKKQLTNKQLTLRLLFGLIGLMIINMKFLTSMFGQIDFTSDKRFTLSPTTISSLKNLKKDVHLTLFLDGDLPSGFQRVKNAATDLAQDMSKKSNGHFSYNIINPLEGDQNEQKELVEALAQRGISPINLNIKTENGFVQKIIYPAAILTDGTKEISINLLQNRTGLSPEETLNNSIQNLEYAFTSAIVNISKEYRSYIGFTEGHGEPSDLELYDAMHTLMDNNQVARVHLDKVSFKDLNQLSVLFIVRPTQKFSESDKYKIDYYIRNGGKVVWAINQIDINMDKIRNSERVPVIARDLNLDDQLFLYGARLNYDLIADMNCAQIPITVGHIGQQPQIELAPWLLFPILMPGNNMPMLKNLDGIRTEFIGTVDTITVPEIRKEIVLQSSPFNKIIPTGSDVSLQMVEQAPDPKTFKNSPKTTAVLLSGSFKNVFQNRPVPAGIEQNIVQSSSMSKPTKMIVMSDGSWLINQINQTDQSPYPLGWDKYQNKQFANKLLLQNMVDYLMHDQQLINLRNREVKLRLLNQALIKKEKIYWQLLNVALPVVLIALFAWIQQTIRKRKYGRKKIA